MSVTGEMLWYYILRWDDENIDIREQYPLDYAKTVEIAESFGLRIPQHIMTTDFLVTKADGRSVAYSVKTNSDLKIESWNYYLLKNITGSVRERDINYC